MLVKVWDATRQKVMIDLEERDREFKSNKQKKREAMALLKNNEELPFPLMTKGNEKQEELKTESERRTNAIRILSESVFALFAEALLNQQDVLSYLYFIMDCVYKPDKVKLNMPTGILAVMDFYNDPSTSEVHEELWEIWYSIIDYVKLHRKKQTL